ncbi:methyltransferase [Corynespora cassiicola Philippines]|uniref:Methyltransferase n=1 Tax=Corynespora cassiicola Philippines TaxID=1448308 RepID=A0A2T2N1F2_CORCC|nr:methyltransferase [Corynespora cassiicola Philippines]
MTVQETDLDKQLLRLSIQVAGLAARTDSRGSQKIQDFLIKTQQSLESPWETLMRYYDLDFQHVAIRIGCDMQVFTTLTTADKPMKLQDIANVNGASERLLGRVLRYLASINTIEEVGQDTFEANHITRTLSQPGIEGGIRLSSACQRPTNSALPDLLVECGFQDITSATETAFNKAWASQEPFFTWVRSQPKIFEYLRLALDVQFREDWLNAFPLESHLGDFASRADPEKVLFVDVGGNLGIQCRGLKAKFPHLSGRIILEDLQETIDVVPALEGVETLAQDYLTEQKVKGAKFYYYRNIFHDNPDERCRLILGALKPAMEESSLLFIDDKVLLNQGSHRHVTMLDLAMMAQVASHERTRAQWQALLEGAGWEIKEIFQYSHEYDCIIVVKPAA